MAETSRPPGSQVLVADDLYRFYHAGDEETRALRGITVTVCRGELAAVVGPSGSGKSTLLTCLAGLDDPDGGTVHVNGERISRQPEEVRAALRARHIGVVYQSNNLLGHLTVHQNIRFAQRLGRASTGTRSGARELLEQVGLGHRSGSFAHQLSGGESARAALAVALANDPAVLLADEPTGELDSSTEGTVLDLLAARAHAGTAVVVASHSVALVTRADQLVELRDGRRVSS